MFSSARRMPRLRALTLALALLPGWQVAARPQLPAAPPVPAAPQVTAPPAVRPIEPPRAPLPSEAQSAGTTRFSFIAYGDMRGAADGLELQQNHGRVVEAMLATVRELAATSFPVRFVVASGDAVNRGADAAAWNVSFSPLVDKLTAAGLPYFFAVGNHDVTGMPIGDPFRELGLRNTAAAMSGLWPPEGSPRRLSGYPTYAFGYGNTFVIMLDSNIASDETQLTWVTRQLEQLDRGRYRHVIAVFHHPPFSSGPHGGLIIEPATQALRTLYAPLFRRHRVRMTITGHEHFLEHWIERHEDGGGTPWRIDHLVSGGGGAPTYTYSAEPDLDGYLAAGAAEHVRVEHLLTPGNNLLDNPNHFVVIRVDGDRLSLRVVATAAAEYMPYGEPRMDLTDEATTPAPLPRR